MDKFVKQWLENDYPKGKTRRQVKRRFLKFQEWTDKTPEELKELDSRESKGLMMQFVNHLREDYADNTILSYVSSVKMFFKYYGIAINFRRNQIPKQKKARGYHTFTNGDLYEIFSIANTQYKALISTLASSGFSIGDVLDLDKQQIKGEIERARENNGNFVFIEEVRGKTNSEALLCLNPLAVKWLERWIEQNDKEVLWSVNYYGFNYMFKKLVKRSGITLTGKIRIHNIRKWTISSLVKAGFNSEEWKYIVGKSINSSDSTYLRIKEEIKQKYREKYHDYLSILPKERLAQEKTEDIKRLQRENETLRTILINLIGKERIEEAIKNTSQTWKEKNNFSIGLFNQMNEKELIELYAKRIKETSQ